ncbi:MAG: glutathione S-transferase N-terminal domain-containing protein [Pseudomonadota bacterium]
MLTSDESSAFAKRSSMTLFSDSKDHYCHRVRIVLAEKNVAVDIINVDFARPPKELADANPYNEVPTLVDRELSLYHPLVMMEYLDERFPHPPLLPVYPVARAQSRLLIQRVERDWVKLFDQIKPNDEVSAPLAKELKESLIGVSPIFDERDYFLSDDFTLVDCCVGPILWRLEYLGITLKERQAKGLFKYARRIFERESFQASLTSAEKEIAPTFFM